MAYYGIERSEEYVLEHGLWGKKATKYIKKKLINGKWRYYYKDASAKAKYAVKRVKQGAEEILNNVKKKAHDEVRSLRRKYDKNYRDEKISEAIGRHLGEDEHSGRYGLRDRDGRVYFNNENAKNFNKMRGGFISNDVIKNYYVRDLENAPSSIAWNRRRVNDRNAAYNGYYSEMDRDYKTKKKKSYY